MIVRLVIQLAAWLLAMALVLFLAAGDPSWAAAWGFLGEMGILGLAVGLWLAWRDPVLLAERMAAPWQSGQAGWDRPFMAATVVGFCAWLALMALDAERWRFSHMPQSLQGIGVLAIAASVWVSWLTFMANRFTAIVVKIQPGQTVIADGPYAFVRHPMYAGAIAYFIGAPLLLGSWLGLALAPLFIAALGVRALGEERLLRAELPDYDAYAARVRYRFVPKVW
jgi:protein-S-isoprenylcysteine O-methyltransferase Ste14